LLKSEFRINSFKYLTSLTLGCKDISERRREKWSAGFVVKAFSSIYRFYQTTLYIAIGDKSILNFLYLFIKGFFLKMFLILIYFRKGN